MMGSIEAAYIFTGCFIAKASALRRLFLADAGVVEIIKIKVRK